MTESRSLEETARDLYGSEYREDPRSEPVRQEADTAAAGLSMEEALQRLREPREQPQERPVAEPRPRQEQPRTEETAQDDGAVWTSAEAEDLATFQREAAQLQHDLVLFDKARQIDLGAIEKQDKGRAEALRTQLREAEAELRQRHERLQGVAEQIASTAQSRQQQRLERHLAAEQRKLAERVPDLDKSALVPYLRRVGFSDEEIAQAADARLIELAEKARRYDEMSTQSTTRKVPVKRKGASRQPPSKPKGEAARAEARFRKTRNIHDAAEMLAARRMEASNG